MKEFQGFDLQRDRLKKGKKKERLVITATRVLPKYSFTRRQNKFIVKNQPVFSYESSNQYILAIKLLINQ